MHHGAIGILIRISAATVPTGCQVSKDTSAKWRTQNDSKLTASGLIHRHCHKIYLMICLRSVAGQNLRYPKMIIRPILRVTDLAIIQDKFCGFT